MRELFYGYGLESMVRRHVLEDLRWCERVAVLFQFIGVCHWARTDTAHLIIAIQPDSGGLVVFVVGYHYVVSPNL